MEFNFEEKFIFGHQNFIKGCFHLRLTGSKSSSGSAFGSLIADHSGILYFPMVSETKEVYVHPVQLLDIRNKGLSISSIYLIEHNKRSYIFVACDLKDGGGYTLLTYCISNLDIPNGDSELSFWQILELPFKIMDAKTVTDEHQNSVIIFCGSDKKMHLYSLDAQCIIRKKKKHGFAMSLLVEQFLLSSKASREEDAYLTTSLPLQLYINQDLTQPTQPTNPTHPTQHTVSDIFLGYSNGITKWFHDSTEILPEFKDSEFIQEIPLFQGNSLKTSNTRKTENKLSNSVKSVLSATRKSRNKSTDDLTKLIEEMCETNLREENGEEAGSKSFDFNIDTSLPSLGLNSIIEDEEPEEPIISRNSSKIEEKKSPPKVEVATDFIENKTLLFDGIVSCLCFYQIPQNHQNIDNFNNFNPLTVEIKNRNIQWSNLKPKKVLYTPCVVVGLASGSTLLVQFDEVERPLSILPNSHHHGGVLAITQGYVSNNICQDIFFGFHDGTVIMVKCEDTQGYSDSDSKLSRVSFSILWQTHFTFPVLGILYGQLLGWTLNPSDSVWNQNNKKNGNEFDNDEDFLSDQLAVVTSKSFHLFSLSLSKEINPTKVDDIDRLVSQMSSLLN